MIVAVLLRNYKCYDKLYFAPICQSPSFSYSALIGQNGVGKSAILESIEAFFDKRDWNLNKKAKKDEAFVAPVFLVEKKRLRLTGEQERLLHLLTDYFWTASDSINPQLKNRANQEFFEFREVLRTKINVNDYFFFVLGREHSAKGRPYFSTFNADIRERMLSAGFADDDEKELFKIVNSHYAYVYVPVEGYVEDVLCLETEEMKELMSKDIIDEIDGVLVKRALNDGAKNVSVVKWINDSLDKFMDEINDVICGVDSSYTFKVDGQYKKNVTAQDVRDRIIDAYFAIRTLKKNKKEIGELSSGEQRQALVDIAYAFLSQRNSSGRHVVLAIDEPEVSLNVAKCLPQFERLYDLVGGGSCQVVFTTHWYGFLPTMQDGTVNYVEAAEDGVKFKIFEMPSFYDQKRRFPNDIELKSVFDFVSALLSLVRSKPYKILIVEGVEDFNYLQSHLNGDRHIKIIPVGGVGNVIKIYKYLMPAFLDEKESSAILGKIFCLIDTDDKYMPFNDEANDKKGNIAIRRLQVSANGVTLVKPGAGGDYKKTTIEDAVDAGAYFLSATAAIDSSGSTEEKQLLSLFEKRDGAEYAFVNHEDSVFVPKGVDGYRKRVEFIACLERHKKKISKLYSEFAVPLCDANPAWIQELNETYLT